MVDKPLVNRVANSGLITLNLEDDYPVNGFVDFDIKSYLFMELILKEKEFRASLKEIDWSLYQDKILLVYCSADAIIPVWAYMLIAAYAKPFAKDIFYGQKEAYLQRYFTVLIKSKDYTSYTGKRIVIKGCSKKPVPASAYLELTAALQPYAQSIMYGEPCSTVPIFKRPRVLKK
jgi:hypothetical protein